MVKKILVGALVAFVIVAAAFSIYNTSQAKSQAAGTTPRASAVAGQGQGQRSGQDGQNHANSGTVTGEPAPQNGFTEWIEYSGVVRDYSAGKFTLVTPTGEEIPAELGNQGYLTASGLALVDGDAVSVVGFWDAGGGLALKSLSLTSTGQTYNFRDEMGRPLWAGGPSRTAP